MPASYNGNAANATGSQVTITNPADGDTDNAASVTIFSKLLADWGQRFLNYFLGATPIPAAITVSPSGGSQTAVTATGTGTGQGGNFTGATGVEGTTNVSTGIGVYGSLSGSPGATASGVTGDASGFATGHGGHFLGSTAEGAIKLEPQATPTTPVNGDVWVDSTTNQLVAEVNGSKATVAPQVPAVNISAFLNGFSAGASQPRYYRDSNGIVHLDGNVVAPSGGPGILTAFTLPVGFRPPSTQTFIGADTTTAPAGTTQIVFANGNVQLTFNGASAGDLIWLSGISFATA